MQPQEFLIDLVWDFRRPIDTQQLRMPSRTPDQDILCNAIALLLEQSVVE